MMRKPASVWPAREMAVLTADAAAAVRTIMTEHSRLQGSGMGGGNKHANRLYAG
jgi:hypothetical protein